MKRREFIAGTGVLIGATCAPGVSAADDAAAVKQAVNDCYSVFYVSLDKHQNG